MQFSEEKWIPEWIDPHPSLAAQEVSFPSSIYMWDIINWLLQH
jgi:hypothetical protein